MQMLIAEDTYEIAAAFAAFKEFTRWPPKGYAIPMLPPRAEVEQGIVETSEATEATGEGGGSDSGSDSGSGEDEGGGDDESEPWARRQAGPVAKAMAIITILTVLATYYETLPRIADKLPGAGAAAVAAVVSALYAGLKLVRWAFRLLCG